MWIMSTMPSTSRFKHWGIHRLLSKSKEGCVLFRRSSLFTWIMSWPTSVCYIPLCVRKLLEHYSIISDCSSSPCIVMISPFIAFMGEQVEKLYTEWLLFMVDSRVLIDVNFVRPFLRKHRGDRRLSSIPARIKRSRQS